jgi:hypothetical protein
MKFLQKILLLAFVLYPVTLLSQSDGIVYFDEKEIMEVKKWRGIGYFLIGDSSVMRMVSCRNSGEICKYSFYQIKFDYKDSTFHLIGQGRNENDLSPFGSFNIYIGKVNGKNLSTSAKFENLKYSTFDIKFKLMPDEQIYLNMGNLVKPANDWEIEEQLMYYSMDSFDLASLVFGVDRKK